MASLTTVPAIGVRRASSGGGGGSTEQLGGTRSYGTVMLVYPSLQINAALMEQSAINTGGNVELFRDFGTYSRCQVTLRWAPEDGSGPYTREVTQTFANQASLVAYVAANTALQVDGTSAEYVVMEIFDVEDSLIVPPAKVYGQNRAYATMVRLSPRGRYHAYQTGSAAYTAGRSFSTPIAIALKQIWDALGYPNVLPPPALWGADEFSLFWLSRNRMRRYDMPQFSPASLQIPGEVGQDRKVYNSNTGTITDRATVGFATGYNPGASERVSYASINSTGSVTGISYQDSWRGLGVALGSGGSILVGYPLIREFAPGEFEYSVFVKPVGVDTFSFEAFDPARYRLEAVGVLRNDFRPKLRPLTLSQPNGTEQAGARTAGFITSGAVAQALGLQPNRFQQAYAGSHGYRSGSVRFQYRDLVTGRVSGLSSAAIKPVWRQRARPFALMVRNQIT
jgi:hypothetical protein